MLNRRNFLKTGFYEGIKLAFTVDTTPPAPPVLVFPEAGDFINNETVDFQWERSTSGDVASYRLQATSGDITTGPFDIDVEIQDPITVFSFTFLGDGTYQWRVGAKDTAGNDFPTGDLEVRTFLLDTEQPTTPQNLILVSAFTGDNLTTDSSPSFQWQRSTDQGFISPGDPLNSGSGVAFYRVEITSAGIVVVTGNVQDGDCDPGVTNFCQFTASGNDALPDGAFTIEVSAVDNADNASAPTTLDLTVDTTSPVAPALVTPEDTALLNTRTVDFQWGASPSGDIFSYRLQATSGDLDTEPLDVDRQFLHPTTVDQITLPGDGTYTWRVIATDDATNTASSVTRTFSVDTIAPGAPGLVSPDDNAFLSTNTPAFEWQTSAGDVQDYLLRVVDSGDDLDVGPFVITALVREPGTGAQAARELADGAYQWQVVARDRALNAASSETRTFTVDTVFAGALLNTGAPFLTPFFDWEEAAGDVEDYLLRAVVSGVDIDAGPFAIDVVIPSDTTEFQLQVADALADGSYQWRVTARDRALNSAPSVIRTFTGDSTRPTTPGNLTEETTGDQRTEVFTWVRSVDPNFPNTGSGVDFYNVAITGPQIILTTADDSDNFCLNNLCRFTSQSLIPGNYNIAVTAVDEATNESPPATADFRAGSEFDVQNLRVIDPVFGSTVSTANPTFGWSPPAKLPDPADLQQGGIDAYEVAITGDPTLAPGFNIPFTDFTDGAFFVECSGSVTGTGLDCKRAIGPNDQIELTVLTPAVPDGTHILRVRVFRLVGIPEDPVELAFTVDSTPPTPPALVAPAVDDLLNTRTIDFAWEPSASEDIASYRLQATSGDITTGPFDIDVEIQDPITVFSFTFLGDGTYQWRVGAKDTAGNDFPTGDLAVRTFAIDTEAPSAPGPVFPESGDFINTRTIEFKWELSASDDISTYRLQATSGDINAGTFDVDRELPHPATSDQVTLPDDADYVWRVGAKDFAGNEAPVGDLETRLFTVDTVAPGVPELVAPEDNDFLNTGAPLLAWEESAGDVEDYLLRVVVLGDDIDAGPFAIDVVIPSNTTEFQVLGAGVLADDTYQWRVVARDRAFNTASSVTRTFAVDTVIPGAPGEPEDVTDPLINPRPRARIIQWDRSTDPGFPNTGSGVEVYNVVISGPQTVQASVLDADCNFGPNNDRCQLTTPELTPALYNIAVTAVDRAINASLPAAAEFRAGPLFVVQNLRVVDAVFVDAGNALEGRKVLGGTVNTGEPRFRWTRPEDLPDPDDIVQGGIGTYEVAIAGDSTLAPGFDIPFTPFTDAGSFDLVCFAQDGNPKGAGQICIGAIVTGDEFEITVDLQNGDVPDGTHLLRVRVVPLQGFGDPGEPVDLPFTVDRTPPDVSTPVKESFDDDDTPEFTFTSEDVHTEVVTFHRVHIESVSFIDITVPGQTVLISPADDQFTGDVRQLHVGPDKRRHQHRQRFELHSGDSHGRPAANGRLHRPDIPGGRNNGQRSRHPA